MNIVAQRPPEIALSNRNSFVKDIAFITPILTKHEAAELMAACGELGPDPSSTYFTKRAKNIAYVICLEGQWFQIRADYFIQPQEYNDFSGGYKRSYREMPKEFIDCSATQKVLFAFKSAYQIPDKEPVLVQVQTSHINANNAGQCLTGQGIHSDGADRAILVCLDRNNITGANNAVYGDLAGHQVILPAFQLEEGHAMLWHDDKVFHHVGPAQDCGSESSWHSNGAHCSLSRYPLFKWQG
ncbi:MAG: 2OG-Fe dioxygenase family protein [Acaryochloridaceae cyanobacterium CSU_3_4]|nr:2OG-Fe dioxygenase family protein [Acaryochloridaceae cyanobacterium CSU_3_4]